MDDGWCGKGTIARSVASVPAPVEEALHLRSGRPRPVCLARQDDRRLGREGALAELRQLVGHVEDRLNQLAQLRIVWIVHFACPVLTMACARLVTGDGSSFR